MTDKNRSKEDLRRELKQLRKRVEELEAGSDGLLDRTVSPQVWEQLAQRSPVGIFIAQNAEFVYVNPIMEKLTGYSVDELMALKPWDLVHPDIREQSQKNHIAHAAGEDILQRQVVHAQNKAGNSVWIDYFAEPIQIDGKPAVMGTVVDITDRVIAEDRLTESEDKYRALVEGSDDAIFTVDKWGTFVFMNEAAAAHMGGNPQDFIGKTQWDIFPKEVADRQMVSILRVIETGKGFSVEAPSIVGGREGIFHTKGTPLRNASGDLIAVTCMSHDHSELLEARGALSASEERYRCLVDSLPVGILQTSPNGDVLSANPALVRMFGCDSVEEYLALPDRDSFRNPAERDKIVKIVKETGEIRNYEVQVRRKDGSYFWISFNGQAVHDKGGKLLHFDGIEVDITEQKLATDALRQSGETMSALLNAPTQSLFLIDTRGILLTLNEALAETLGRSVEELVGTCVHDYIPESLIEFRKAKELEVIESGKPIKYIDEHGGNWREIRLFPVFDGHGRVEALAVYSLDITKRKQMELQLRQQSEKYLGIFDESIAAIYIFDTDKNFTDSNLAGLELLGYSKEELLGMKVADVDADPVAVLPEHQQILDGGRVVNLEHKLVRKDGQVITVLNNSRSLTNEDGEIVGMQSTLIDITERERSADALKASEERYRGLFEHSQTGMFRSSIDGKTIQAVNQKMADIWGGSIEEALQKGSLEAWDNSADRDEFVRLLKRDGVVTDFEGRMRSTQGTPLYALISALMIPEEGVIEGSVVDITDRKLAEEALEESEGRFRGILSSLHETMIVMYDRDGNYLEAWMAADLEERYGVTGQSLVGKSVRDFMPPEMLPHVLDTFRKMFADGESVREEYLMPLPAGEFWHDISISPVRGDSGEVVALVGFIRDITERKKAEDDLRESEERLRSTVQSMDDLLFLLDDKGIFVDYYQPDFTQRLFASPKRFLGKSVEDVLPPSVSEKTLAAIESLRNDPAPQRFDYSMKVGKVTGWYSAVLSRRMRADGSFAGITCVIRDISERKRAEEAIRESEIFNRAVTENSPLGISVRNRNGKLLSVNQAWRDFWEISEEDVLKYMAAVPNVLRLDYKDDYLGEWQADVVRIYREGGTLRVPEIRVDDHRSGQTRWVSHIFYAIMDDNDVVDRMIILTSDITERKRTEEALRQGDETMRALMNAPTDILFLIDREGVIKTLNEAAAAQMGKTSGELIGTNVFDLLPAEVSERRRAKGEQVLETGKPLRFTDTRDGRFFHNHLFPVMGGDGTVEAIAVYSHDITSRKKAEDDLRSSQANLLSILENTDDLIMLADRDSNIVYMNSAFAKAVKDLIGIDVEPGINLNEKMSADERKQWLELYDRVLSGERFLQEFSWVAVDGVTRHFETWFSPIRSDDEVHGFSQFTHEVTERKEAETAIRESEDKFRRIAERSFDAIFVTDIAGNLTFASPAAETVLGYNPEDMVGRNVSEFVDGSSLPEIARGFAENAQGRSVEGILVKMIRADGETVHTEVNATAVFKGGRVVGSQAIVRDVSLRRRAEEMLQQSYDEQSRQLRQVAGGLAHDVYNDLFPVAAAIHKLRQRLLDSAEPVGERDRSLLLIMDKAIRRAINLTESVNLYSKLDRSEFDVGSDLASTVDEVAEQNRDQVSEQGILLEIDMPDPLDVNCPRIQVFHLFNNLLLNAIDAMQDSKTRLIRISATLEDKLVKVRFEDSGCGISAAVLSRIFEPFYSTRPKTGTGLGLAIALRIVDLAGGKIEVKSVLDEGTTFTITLPGNVGTRK